MNRRPDRTIPAPLLAEADVPDSPPLSLRANAGWAFAGSASYLGCQWLVMVALARAAGPIAVGVFALGSAIAMPIILLSQLALRHALIADGMRRNTFSDYVILRLAMTVLALAAILGTAMATGHGGRSLLALGIIGVGRCAESVNDIFLARLHRQRRLDRVARMMMLQGAMALLLAGCAVIVTHDVVWAAVGFATALVLVSMLSAALAWRGLRPATPADGSRLRRIAVLSGRSAPLAVGHALTGLNLNTPRYAVERLIGAAGLGQYAAVEQLVSAANLISGAVSSADLPQLAHHNALGDGSGFRRVFWRLFGVNVGVGLIATLGAAVVGAPVIRLVYGPAFAEAGRAFPWITAAYTVVLAANALGAAVTAQGRFVAQAPIAATALAVNSAIVFTSVTHLGIPGAACGIAAAASVQVASYFWLLRGALAPPIAAEARGAEG